MSTATLARAEHHHGGIFLRHLGEMTVAMFMGMFVFGALLGVIAAAAGSSLESVRLSQPELFMAGMVSAMSVTMVAWMRHRGHTWREGAEMTASMVVATLVVLVFYWAGAIPADPVCPFSCMLMIPAMALTMLFRLDVYSTRMASR
jgi:hypothetical protein